LWSWKLPDNGTLAIEDLITGQRANWSGKWQHISLDPEQPFAIWRVRRGV